MNEIQGNARTVRELLKGVKYTIDYYQREYKWKDKQVRELIDDLSGKFLEEYQVEHTREKVEEIHILRGQNSLTVKNGKGGKSGRVSFNSKLKTLITEYLDYRKSESKYLFPSERGAQMTRFGIGRVFKKMATMAGLDSKHTIHTLRHTYATNLYKASGYNLRMVQKQLGHSNISTTTVYSDVISKDLEDALENLE